LDEDYSNWVFNEDDINDTVILELNGQFIYAANQFPLSLEFLNM